MRALGARHGHLDPICKCSFQEHNAVKIEALGPLECHVAAGAGKQRAEKRLRLQSATVSLVAVTAVI